MFACAICPEQPWAWRGTRQLAKKWSWSTLARALRGRWPRLPRKLVSFWPALQTGQRSGQTRGGAAESPHRRSRPWPNPAALQYSRWRAPKRRPAWPMLQMPRTPRAPPCFCLQTTRAYTGWACGPSGLYWRVFGEQEWFVTKLSRRMTLCTQHGPKNTYIQRKWRGKYRTGNVPNMAAVSGKNWTSTFWTLKRRFWKDDQGNLEITSVKKFKDRKSYGIWSQTLSLQWQEINPMSRILVIKYFRNNPKYFVPSLYKLFSLCTRYSDVITNDVWNDHYERDDVMTNVTMHRPYHLFVLCNALVRKKRIDVPGLARLLQVAN